jgi:tetratricopeptide (TPR) repeat protein
MTRFLNKTLVCSLLALMSSTLVWGQNPADMPLRQIIELAQTMIGKGDFAGASPFLDELEVRFEDEKDPAVEKILQQFGFVRGVGYLQSFAKTGNKDFIVKGASAFGFFAEKFPNDSKAVMAMQKRTDCLRSLQDWKEAARVIETLLDPQQPYRKQILKRSELLDLYYGKAQCYHIEQDWSKGEPAFKDLLKFADSAKDEDRAAYAVSCLTEMFVQTKRINEVFPLLPRLSGDTPARYDLRLNVNLMQGAQQLKEEERHVEASLFYSLTMTTEEIVAYYTERLKRLETELNRLDQFIKIRGQAMPARRLEILKDKVNELAMKSTSAKGHLKQASDTPSFTTILRWRKSDNFQATQRDWESFWGFYWLYNDFPEHEMVENFLYAAFASANTVKFREKSIELGELYLKNKDWKKFRADVTFIMCNAYRLQADSTWELALSLRSAMSTVDKDRAQKAKEQSAQYYQRFFLLCDDFLTVMPDHKYAKDFVNMMGAVYFRNRKYEELLEKFAGYENGEMNPSKGFVNRPDFRKSPGMATAHYMSGLALLATGRFEEAKPMLSAVVGVNVEGLPLDDGGLSTYDDSDEIGE